MVLRSLLLASLAAIATPMVAVQHSHQQTTKRAPSCSEMLSASMMHMHESMATVATTGEFDSDFMKLMIPHHVAALEMAKAELLCGKDPAARRLAQEIIADQSSEIDLMKLYLKQTVDHHAALPTKTPSAQTPKEK